MSNLFSAPADAVSKKLVASLVRCPTLDAPSRETQANPLLDNYEGMTIVGGPRLGHRLPDQRRQLQRHPVHPRPQPPRQAP